MRLVNTILFCCLLTTTFASSSLSEQDSTKEKRNSLIGLPIVYSTPETSWAFGAAGIYAFRWKNQSLESLPSQVQLGFAYTLFNQVLLYLPYQLFFQEQKYKLYGEFGYYRYNYFFYGIGNNPPSQEEEIYDVNYPRVRLNALYQVRPYTFVGLRYWMDGYDIVGTEMDGQLSDGNITGNQGGVISGAGIVANYDTRDNIFYPTEGSFAETVLFWNTPTLGSDFEYAKWTLDATKYFQNKWEHVLAINAYAELTSDGVPFNEMALLGGNKRMRGYYQGRYRDNNMLVVQAEYRFPLFWRFGAAVFGGYGGVAENVTDFQLQHFKYSVGGGLRILLSKEEKINVRIDYGFGQGSQAFYLTIGEAF